MTHHVYTFWRMHEPLYTGCTGNLPQRMRAHESRPWHAEATHISTVAFDSADEAFAAEARLIGKLRPRYNKRWNPAYCDLEDVLPDERFTIRDRKRAALRALKAAS
jgi:predicted GIY-YIG superfamily endonuclease